MGSNSIHQTPSGGGSITNKKLSEKINNKVSLSQPLFSPGDDYNGSSSNGISGVVSPPNMQGERDENDVHSYRREEGQQQQQKNKVINYTTTKKKTSNQKKVGITIPPRPSPDDGVALLQWQGNFMGGDEESMFGMWSDKEKPSGWGEATYESKDIIRTANASIGSTNNCSSISSGGGDIGGFGGLGNGQHPCDEGTCDPNVCRLRKVDKNAFDPFHYGGNRREQSGGKSNGSSNRRSIVAGVNGSGGGYAAAAASSSKKTKSSSNQTKPKRGGDKKNKRKSPVATSNEQLTLRVEGENIHQHRTISHLEYSTDRATNYNGDNESLAQICQRSTARKKKNTNKKRR